MTSIRRTAPLLGAGIVLLGAAAALAQAAASPQSARTGLDYYVLACAGLAGTLLAWRRADRAALVIVIAVALVARVVLYASEPIFSNDAYRYLWDGRVMLAGFDPLALAPNDPALTKLAATPLYALIDYRTIPSLYPPFAYALFCAGALLRDGVFGEKAVMLAGDVAVVVLLLFALRRKNLPSGRVAVYAWSPLVLLEFGQSGHLESWAIAGVLAALLALGSGRFAIAAAALVFATLLKLTPAAFVPIAFARAPRWIVVSAFGCIAIYGLAYALGVPASRSLGHYLSVQRFYPTVFVVAGPVGSALIFAAVVAFATWRARLGQSFATGVVAIQTAFLVCSPNALPWYATLVPAMVPLVERPSRTGRAVVAILVVAAGLFPLAYGPPEFPPASRAGLAVLLAGGLLVALAAALFGIPSLEGRLQPAVSKERV